VNNKIKVNKSRGLLHDIDETDYNINHKTDHSIYSENERPKEHKGRMKSGKQKNQLGNVKLDKLD